jgi:hypothetical protein
VELSISSAEITSALPRRATRPGKGQREQRLGEKRERSEVKAARQRRPSRDD